MGIRSLNSGRKLHGVLSPKVSAIALMVSMPMIAHAADTVQPAGVEEIVVTGSRIVRDGFDAPTPVTVLGVEQLQDSGKPSIADVLNLMPAFQGSISLAGAGNQNGGKSGANSLNLRNLGPQRVLVLFNGHRVPPYYIDGSVDANLLPDALISRVDVVTGGASAVYGSDAVAGVVNFILDTNFSGVKGAVQGGVTERGDGRNFKISLAAGTPFANGRGHILVSGDVAKQDAIRGDARDWNMQGYYGILNPAYTPTNGQPRVIYRTEVAHANGYFGGIISGGPLKGIAFGEGGTPFQYNYGDLSLLNTSYQVGGDWRSSTQAGATDIYVGPSQNHSFARVSYDLTDTVQVYAQVTNANIHSRARCCWAYYLGNLTVRTDNAFLPQSVADRARTLGLTSLPLGYINRFNDDGFGGDYKRVSFIYTAGAEGTWDALGTGWKWSAYLQRGLSKLSFWNPYTPTVADFGRAMDAVRAPNGAIVCRSTLTNPGDGCVPWNVFGTGVNTRAAFDYITGGATAGGPRQSMTMAQNGVGFDISGEPFQSWAGPVSLALSAEYRKDTEKSISDPISAVRGWYSTQFVAFPASNSVVEGAIETVIPLASEESWAESLDFNGAVRVTDYEASGFVSTWKAGLTYSPVTDLRLRLTQSRDIRAPSLLDLFATPQTTHGVLADPFKGNVSYDYYPVTRGNLDVKPEKAETTGIGVVYQPGWLSGFSASVDYYRINIKGAIASISHADVLNNCFAGQTSFCSDVHRLPPRPGETFGDLNEIISQPRNQARNLVKGIDFEASYQTELSEFVPSWDGALNLRALATKTLTNLTDTGLPGTTRVLDRAGVLPSPSWTMNLSGTYSVDAFRLNWTGRFVSKSRNSVTNIECKSGCPAPVAGFTTVDDNTTPAYFLQNVSLNYRFYEDGVNNAEAYFNVDNITDRAPPLIAPFGGVTYSVVTSISVYDLVGRAFRAGIRFRM